MVDSPPAAAYLPAALLKYDQWLCWREEERDGKATKIPIDPTSAEFASTTDPRRGRIRFWELHRFSETRKFPETVLRLQKYPE